MRQKSSQPPKLVSRDDSVDPSDHGEALQVLDELGNLLSPSYLDGVDRIAFHDFDGHEGIVLMRASKGWRAVECLADSSGIQESGIEAHHELGPDPRGLLAAAFLCEYPHVEVMSSNPSQARDLVMAMAAITSKCPQTLNETVLAFNARLVEHDP